ncbi:hypothetical protein Aph01nite_43810 [Acrocarpospora phusangensis]|uniref:Uncharacterized protein n=2 Tax=Acrocarpospora phusangensis TaxID=1070424 RepID=A0A919ULE3_9ACTN|nr:hypothetical protein Aph01nite_43810 [Acrocarpospora phusangensis]
MSGELLTFGGQVLVHDNRGELEYLLPGARVVPYDGDLPTLPIRDHPSMASVQWPLRREDFR